MHSQSVIIVIFFSNQGTPSLIMYIMWCKLMFLALYTISITNVLKAFFYEFIVLLLFNQFEVNFSPVFCDQDHYLSVPQSEFRLNEVTFREQNH